MLQYFLAFILEYRHNIIMCYFPNEESFYTLSFTIKQDAPGNYAKNYVDPIGWIEL